MIKYTFIHPTKTGGTACENYFDKYYNKYITGIGHENLCENDNNSIIIVRDVYDRFISMYNYWKNGAIDLEIHKRDAEFISIYKNITIKDYISFIKNNEPKLITKITTKNHLKLISDWINNTKYENIIIIYYKENLNDKIQKLLEQLEIPNKNIVLNKLNITKKIEEEIFLDEDDKIFIEKYFEKDFELINNIKNRPELFKLVI